MTNSPTIPGIGLLQDVREFFHEPVDARVVALVRRGYALLLLVNVFCWGPDLDRWFSSEGVLSMAAARQLAYPGTWSLFQVLPDSPLVVRLLWVVLIAQTIALFIGWRPRLQAIGCFVGLVTFQNRNPLIFDGEDTLFRILGFLMILMPSVPSPSTQTQRVPLVDGWPLRLLQLEMTLVYFSAAWMKLLGAPWRDGTALYYVMRLEEYWGRLPLPESLLTSAALIRIMTWSTVGVEFAVPVLIWFAPTRRLALGMVVLFHLACEAAMHLFLFHPIMLVGWMSFLTTHDMDAILRRLRRLPRGSP